MTTAFPYRLVADDEATRLDVHWHQLVFKSLAKHGAHRDMARAMKDVQSAIEAASLSKSIPHHSGNGQQLTLEFLKGEVVSIISDSDLDWIRGCDGVSVIHPPSKREKLLSIIHNLPFLWDIYHPTKAFTVAYGDECFVFKVRLHENSFLPTDSLVLALDNPKDPAAERLVQQNKTGFGIASQTFNTKEHVEHFAIDSVCQDLTLHNGTTSTDISRRYEPLGHNTFPDFELAIRGQLWGVEVTRIEEDMVSYIDVTKGIDRRRVRKATQYHISGDRILKALANAIDDKNEKRKQCNSYSRYCLLLVDTLDCVPGKDFVVSEDLDLSVFDAIVLVKLDGSVLYIKGKPCTFIDLL